MKVLIPHTELNATVDTAEQLSAFLRSFYGEGHEPALAPHLLYTKKIDDNNLPGMYALNVAHYSYFVFSRYNTFQHCGWSYAMADEPLECARQEVINVVE